ncbi:MAG TPA: PIN domain-containing protein [Opitutaceae bacterium]|nr:PIN domain-containing protein [Opitutaceae bacterium]
MADTPVWSAAFRRADEVSALRAELEWLVSNGAVAILGPIRQELLSGIKERAQFDQVRTALRHFPDVNFQVEDFETAAEYYNICRSKGVQGSMTDFLICAVAARTSMEIFTTDGDFQHYSKHLPIALYVSAAA